MHLYHELGKVLGLLRDENIPVIVLKGVHLAELVYGNIAFGLRARIEGWSTRPKEKARKERRRK
jgi:hypothetical protein